MITEKTDMCVCVCRLACYGICMGAVLGRGCSPSPLLGQALSSCFCHEASSRLDGLGVSWRFSCLSFPSPGGCWDCGLGPVYLAFSSELWDGNQFARLVHLSPTESSLPLTHSSYVPLGGIMGCFNTADTVCPLNEAKWCLYLLTFLQLGSLRHVGAPRFSLFIKYVPGHWELHSPLCTEAHGTLRRHH